MLSLYIFVSFIYRDKLSVNVSCKDIISEALPLDFGNQIIIFKNM
jgi:hypothetical protein